MSCYNMGRGDNMVNWSLSKVVWNIAVEDDTADYAMGELELNLDNGNITGLFRPTYAAIDTVANELKQCGIEIDETAYDLVNYPIFKIEGDKFYWKISVEVQNPTNAQVMVIDALRKQFEEDVVEMWLEFN